ncbi:MAG: hypothetical protein LBI59_07220 [Candidatus Accumulibacter sp.]|jgi:hypothetical protein|nr:hypothetical protein [Accumulibacter sp.]
MNTGRHTFYRVLLCFSFYFCAALCSGIGEADAGEQGPQMKRIDMSFPELIHNLKVNRPITHDTLAGLGFSGMAVKTFSNGARYTDTDIVLTDGNVISKIELRTSAKRTFLVLSFDEPTSKQAQLEAEFGAFRLFDGPRGRSIHEKIVYRNNAIENFTLMYGLDQTTREIKGFSIDSVFGE